MGTDSVALVELLRRSELTIRTGILLIPLMSLGHESEVAAGFGIGHQDICEWVLQKTPLGRRQLGLSSELLLHEITNIISEKLIPGNCILISNLDFLLAGVKPEDRNHFWSFFKNNFRRDRGVLLTLPHTSQSILPVEQREVWKSLGRLSVWVEEGGR